MGYGCGSFGRHIHIPTCNWPFDERFTFEKGIVYDKWEEKVGVIVKLLPENKFRIKVTNERYLQSFGKEAGFTFIIEEE